MGVRKTVGWFGNGILITKRIMPKFKFHQERIPKFHTLWWQVVIMSSVGPVGGLLNRIQIPCNWNSLTTDTITVCVASMTIN